MAYHFQMPIYAFLSWAGYEYFGNLTPHLFGLSDLSELSPPPPLKGSKHSHQPHAKIEQGQGEDGIWSALWQQSTAALGNPGSS